MKKTRAAVLMLLILIISILLLCNVCIAFEAQHECFGEGCPICAHMHLCMDITHGLGTERLHTVLIGAICISLFMAIVLIGTAVHINMTPVAMRVRQNS